MENCKGRSPLGSQLPASARRVKTCRFAVECSIYAREYFVTIYLHKAEEKFCDNFFSDKTFVVFGFSWLSSVN